LIYYLKTPKEKGVESRPSMPANLPPQYFSIEKKLREARTPGEKISVIEELLTIIPKHKGTERLRGDYKRRLAKLREEQQQGRSKGKSGGGFTRVEREGTGQVALVGSANSGKSLLKALTKAPRNLPIPLPPLPPARNDEIRGYSDPAH
jgi:hypothetical protein